LTCAAYECLTCQIRFSLRLLTRNPLFAVVAIGTLALGIAANTAVLPAVDALLPHPLHFQHPEQLVLVTKNLPTFDLSKSVASPLDFLDYRRDSKSFSGMAAFDSRSVNFAGGEKPLRVSGLRTTAAMFPMLGAETAGGPILHRA